MNRWPFSSEASKQQATERNQRAARKTLREQQLLQKLPDLPDTQSAWLILLLSAVPRANHLLRTVPPAQIASYAQAHDAAIWETLNKLLGTTSFSLHRLLDERCIQLSATLLDVTGRPLKVRSIRGFVLFS